MDKYVLLFWFVVLHLGNYADYLTTKKFRYGSDMEGNILCVLFAKLRKKNNWGKTILEFKVIVGIFLTASFIHNLHNTITQLRYPLIAGIFCAVSIHNIRFLQIVENLNFYQFRKMTERTYFIKQDFVVFAICLFLSLLLPPTKTIFDAYGIISFFQGIWLFSVIISTFLLVGILANNYIAWRS